MNKDCAYEIFRHINSKTLLFCRGICKLFEISILDILKTRSIEIFNYDKNIRHILEYFKDVHLYYGKFDIMFSNSHITSMIICGDYIGKIPDRIRELGLINSSLKFKDTENLKYLEEVYIKSDCYYKILDKYPDKLSIVRGIHFEIYDDIPEYLDLHELKYLYFDNNYEGNVGNMTNLTYLKCPYHCSLQGIENLINLTHLDIINRDQDLDLSNLKNLTYINLSSCDDNITGIENLKLLQSLNLGTRYNIFLPLINEKCKIKQLYLTHILSNEENALIFSNPILSELESLHLCLCPDGLILYLNYISLSLKNLALQYVSFINLENLVNLESLLIEKCPDICLKSVNYLTNLHKLNIISQNDTYMICGIFSNMKFINIDNSPDISMSKGIKKILRKNNTIVQKLNIKDI